jgi:arylformamidase
LRLYDLSQPLGPDTSPYPGHPAFRTQVFQTWPRDRLNTYLIETSMHTGTHVDAPFHMTPDGLTVGEVPLERLYGSAVIVDLATVVDEWTIVTPAMVEAYAPDRIRRDDIVILHYGWSRYSRSGEARDLEKFFCRHPGPDRALVDWLAEVGVKWVGTDGPSFEHPMNIFLKRGRPDLVRLYEARTGQRVEDVFPDEDWLYAHLELGRHGICHVDQLGGELARVAGRRMDVGVFPWRWVGGDASVARVVAFAPDE